MVHITEMCVGCRMCQIVCSLAHEGLCGPSSSRVALSFKGVATKASFDRECDECGLCAEYCPYGAMERRERS